MNTRSKRGELSRSGRRGRSRGAFLTSLGVQTLEKSLVFSNLRGIDPALDKIEGLALSGCSLVVCADNDFNLAGADLSTNPATLILQSPPNVPKIVTIPLTPECLAGRSPDHRSGRK